VTFPSKTIGESQSYTGGGTAPSEDPVDLVMSPPLSRQQVLRNMSLGFGLAVLLVLGAAYVGYQGSLSIQNNAQELVREHLVATGRGAELESRIEEQSRALLDELVWILGACFILAAGSAGMTIWVVNRAFRRLEWQTEELHRVGWHMLESHEKIARRFSHEMHDELGQALAGLKGMTRRMSGTEFEQRRAEYIEVLDDVLRSVRELSQLLRPVILDDFGLDAGLRWLAERFSERTRIEVDYASDYNQRLSEQLETHLFRITQEALTNIARHSGAAKASIRFEVDSKRVRLTIEDNGRGIEDQSHPGRPSMGMVGMRSRARQVGGELKVENRETGGLRIEVEAPLRRAQDADEQEDPGIAG
jgi:signal transduction histidine kinase